MALNPQNMGPNQGTRSVKTSSLRLSDDPRRTTTDYAELIVGSGPPAGAYGRAAGVPLGYFQLDSDSADQALWLSADAGTTWIRAGAPAPERYSLRWQGGQRGKPGINADINSATEAVREIADPDFEILGTNAVSSCSTYATDGGITLTTTTASSDQVILVPHLDSNQSAWNTVLWPTSKSLVYEAQIKTGSSLASVVIWCGLKLTNTHVAATDDDQVFVRFESGTNNDEFQVISSIAGVDTTTDTNIAPTVSTGYNIRIVLNSSRVAKVYINGTLVVTTAALSSVNLIPYVGVQTLTTAAKVVGVRSQAISRLY